MTDELKDLESELDEALKDDEITDDDFAEVEADEAEQEPEVDDEPEQQPEPKAVIEDVNPEIEKAANRAQQWQAYLASKEQELEQIRAKLIEAEDTGESPQIRLQLQEQLADTKLEIRDARQSAQQAIDYHRQVSAPKPEAMRAWIAANPKYRTDPSFKARVDQYAIQLHDKEGMNPSHARFYSELDKRLMAKKTLGKPGKQGAAPVRRASPAGQSKDQPSDFDRRWMPKIGLNPSDKRHLAEWRHHVAELATESR